MGVLALSCKRSARTYWLWPLDISYHKKHIVKYQDFVHKECCDTAIIGCVSCKIGYICFILWHPSLWHTECESFQNFLSSWKGVLMGVLFLCCQVVSSSFISIASMSSAKGFSSPSPASVRSSLSPSIPLILDDEIALSRSPPNLQGSCNLDTFGWYCIITYKLICIFKLK